MYCTKHVAPGKFPPPLVWMVPSLAQCSRATSGTDLLYLHEGAAKVMRYYTHSSISRRSFSRWGGWTEHSWCFCWKVVVACSHSDGLPFLVGLDLIPLFIEERTHVAPYFLANSIRNKILQSTNLKQYQRTSWNTSYPAIMLRVRADWSTPTL